MLSRACESDNFESNIFSFTNIRGLRSNFVDCKSFVESNSPDILALCKTNLDDSIDSGNFSVRGYLPLIRRDSGAHMHGLTDFLLHGTYLYKNLQIFTYVFDWLYFTQCLFSSIDHLIHLCVRSLILFHLT